MNPKLLCLAACACGPVPTRDVPERVPGAAVWDEVAPPTDGDTSAEGSDTGDRSDTGSPTDAGSTAPCEPTPFGPAAPASAPPLEGELVVLRIAVSFCATASRADGAWRIQLVSPTGGYHCQVEIPFSSTFPTLGCQACDLAFTGLQYPPSTHAGDADLCAPMGLGPSPPEGSDVFHFESALRANSPGIGVSDEPETYREISSWPGGWELLSAAETRTTTRMDADGVTQVTTAWSSELVWR